MRPETIAAAHRAADAIQEEQRLRQPKISLVEAFRSMQGEGYNTGRDAIFLRFTGCNLACVFAPGVVCDTPYQQANHKVTLHELEGTVARLLEGSHRLSEDPEHRHMIVLTGGEPTLQPQFDAIVTMLRKLGCYLAVETNGTTWRESLLVLDWITVSPKDDVVQGSSAAYHNPHPQDPTLDVRVIEEMYRRRSSSGEFRYVISGPHPDGLVFPYQFYPAFRHYVSPALRSDGSGEEWKHGFPGFVPGALEECQRIVRNDPRWRISTQVHKVWGVR